MRFTWLLLMDFLRITTDRAAFVRPLTMSEAVEQAEERLDSPNAIVLNPGPAHLGVLGGLLGGVGTVGNLVNVAHPGAVATEHRAEIVSYGTDLARFGGVRRRRPDVLLAGEHPS